MFATDRNIDRIAALVEETRRWLSLRVRIMRLSATDKTVCITAALVVGGAVAALLLFSLIYFSLAAALWLGELLRYLPLGFIAVGMAQLVLAALVIRWRKVLIERPLKRFLIDILTDEDL